MTRHKLILVFLVGTIVLVTCGSPGAVGQEDSTIKLAPVSELSPELRSLPLEVQEAYRFALANPDILEKIPCYCGCSAVGHTSNLECYVRPTGAGGQTEFDYHGAG